MDVFNEFWLYLSTRTLVVVHEYVVGRASGHVSFVSHDRSTRVIVVVVTAGVYTYSPTS